MRPATRARAMADRASVRKSATNEVRGVANINELMGIGGELRCRGLSRADGKPR